MGESVNENEVNPELAKTAAGYFTPQEAVQLILKDGFFKDLSSSSPKSVPAQANHRPTR